MNNETKQFPPTNKQYALKIFNLTDADEEEIGAQLAKIFNFKKEKKTGFWKTGPVYGTKTNKGLTRVFINLIDKINEGRNLLD